MAASDKNILISPQRGSTTDVPSIVLTGDGNDPLTISVLDGTPGSLSVEASSGQLFSITNNLTSGSIFSVNDISGIPSLDIDANGTIQLAPFGGTVGIGVTTVSARLHVAPTSAGIGGLFSGTTSTDMVRITQLGTGNALVVEDEASPDSTPFVVNASGNVGIGTTTPISLLNVGVDLVGESKSVIFGKRLAQTSSTAFPVQVIGDLLIDGNGFGESKPMGNLVFHIENNANNGIIWRTTQYGFSGYSAGILAIGGAPYAPAGLAFYTSTSAGPSFTQTAPERLRIAGNGNVGIGTTNPTQKLHVAGGVILGSSSTDTLTVNASPTINSPTVFNINSTVNALRITQVGTGNALVVEDETNPDSTPFVVDATGNVGIKKSTPTVELDVVGSANFTGTVTASSGTLISGIEVKKETTSVSTGITALDFTGSSVSTVTAASGVATINITADISPVMMGMIF